MKYEQREALKAECPYPELLPHTGLYWNLGLIKWTVVENQRTQTTLWRFSFLKWSFQVEVDTREVVEAMFEEAQRRMNELDTRGRPMHRLSKSVVLELQPHLQRDFAARFAEKLVRERAAMVGMELVPPPLDRLHRWLSAPFSEDIPK